MDIMATCVDLADAEYPTTYKGHDILPMEGKSLLPIFKTGHRKGHDYLGFEHFNERAFLSNDGWKLVRPKNNSQWELYNLNEDRSEQHDLAAKYPEKVAAIRSEEYYVNMMRAWYFATALAKQYEKILPFLEEQRMDIWTHNKTIQKSIESYRITQEQKDHLRTLRIKK